MADYYPLIARAVSSLDSSTADSRRAIYERARTALMAQLHGVDPALSESDITRERLALEEAIRRVESEAAKRPRIETSRWEQEPGAAERLPDDEQHESPDGEAETFFSSREIAEDYEGPNGEMRPEPRFSGERDFGFLRGEEADNGRAGRSLSDEGLKDFRNSMAAELPGDAERPIGQVPQDPFDAFPAPRSDAKRIEPEFEAEDLLRAPRELPSPARRNERLGAESRGQADRFSTPRRTQPLGAGFPVRNLLIAVAVLVLAAAAFFGYRQWPNMFGKAGPSAASVAQKAPPASSKIADRVGAEGQPSSAAPGDKPAAEVAQRAVLYEQVPNSQEHKHYLGSVLWRTETVSPGPGLPPEVAIKADVEIPERQMRVMLVLERNLDKNLPATHTIEVLFGTPPNFSPGGIADVPGVLMQDDRNSAVPLAGLRVKVTEGYFLIGLTPSEPAAQRNKLLLKDRPWLQIPISYKDGQHALIVVEKGVPGERVFGEAFAAWKE